MPYKNPEDRKQWAREWRRLNPGVIDAKPARVAYKRRYYLENKVRIKDMMRRNRFLKRYGITPEKYEGLLVYQRHCCAICLSLAPGKWSLHVDHYHATGEVRGLLCLACNTALGQFRDDPRLLRRAADYVDRRLI